jgi:hypothetical protein
MKQRVRPSILIGIPRHNPTDEFLVSLLCFLEEIKDHYTIEVMEVSGKSLVDAQNEIAEKFISSNYAFLLLLENDNWGFTRNMLKTLLRSNAEVCAQHYYSRWMPYYSTCMRQIDGKTEEGGPLFAGHNAKSGYVECDLVGYGMTLYKRSVFEKLEKPYFRLNKFGGPGNYATDIDFSSRCREANIVLLGSFDYTLNHQDIRKCNGTKDRRNETG